MRQPIFQCWEHFFHALARHLQIQRIGAKIYPARPFDGTILRNGDLLEGTRLVPNGKHASANQRTQINDT